TVQDTLPAGVAFVLASPIQGTYNSATRVWAAGTVNPGAPQTPTILLTGTSPKPGPNTAAVSHPDQFDPHPPPNSTTAPTPPGPPNPPHAPRAARRGHPRRPAAPAHRRPGPQPHPGGEPGGGHPPRPVRPRPPQQQPLRLDQPPAGRPAADQGGQQRQAQRG